MQPNKFEYSEEYRVGIDEIDEQHENVINVINELYSIFSKDEVNNDKVENLIRKLDDYASEHFKVEELYAEKYGFPEIDRLKREHEFFRSVYREIRESASYYKDSNKYSNKILVIYAVHLASVLASWLNKHLLLDKDLADHIKKFKDNENSEI